MEPLLILFAIPFIIFIVDIVIIVTVLKDDMLSNNSKIFWVAILLFANAVGLLVYFIVDDKDILY